MGVLCFSSLKGGVGKTAAAVNLSHALAKRGCEVVLIDLDPAAHATGFFDKVLPEIPPEAVLGAVLHTRKPKSLRQVSGLLESETIKAWRIRDNLSLLPAAACYRQLLYILDRSAFLKAFGWLIEDLSCTFDYVVIDTPPDFNVFTVSALTTAKVVVVPVDSSAMSIAALEELVGAAERIRGPVWAVLRTMVTKQALRTRRLSESRLESSLGLRICGGDEPQLDDPDVFINQVARLSAADGGSDLAAAAEPIYLLNTVLYRTEQQNRLSFAGETAFDRLDTATLAAGYTALAKELECLCGAEAELSEDVPFDGLLAAALHKH